MKKLLTLLCVCSLQLVYAQNFSGKLRILNDLVEKINMKNASDLLRGYQYRFGTDISKTKSKTYLYGHQTNSDDIAVVYFSEKNEFQGLLLTFSNKEYKSAIRELKELGFKEVRRERNGKELEVQWRRPGYRHAFVSDDVHKKIYLYNRDYLDKYK
ncbi:MAG: hypothetical protein IPN22_15610 [Bacteroidetes bacterium]|nr:hypothetical protein [Bacteroidota bacterium]